MPHMIHQTNSVLGLLAFCYLVSYVYPINGRWYEETCRWWEDSIIDSLWIRIATAWLRQAWSISYQFKCISHRWQQRLWDFQPIMIIIDSSLLNTNWISKNAHNPTTTPNYLLCFLLNIICICCLSFSIWSCVRFLSPDHAFSTAVDFSDTNSVYKMLNFNSLNSLDIN